MVGTPPKPTQRRDRPRPAGMSEELEQRVLEVLRKFDPEVGLRPEDAAMLSMTASRFKVRYPRSVMECLEHQAILDAMPMHETRRGST